MMPNMVFAIIAAAGVAARARQQTALPPERLRAKCSDPISKFVAALSLLATKISTRQIGIGTQSRKILFGVLTPKPPKNGKPISTLSVKTAIPSGLSSMSRPQAFLQAGVRPFTANSTATLPWGLCLSMPPKASKLVQALTPRGGAAFKTQMKSA